MSEQVPGFYRHAIGDITVTAFNDGVLKAGPEVLLGIDAETAAALLIEAFLPPRPVITVSAFMVQSGGVSALIDAGAGGGMGPEAGRLAANLTSAGVSPGDIDLVLVTHMHPDHIGGLLDAGGGAVFPRARILVSKSDAAVFLDPAIAERVPDEAKPVFAAARALEAAYAGRFETFDGVAEVMLGVSPVSLPGHSPGHTGYRITSGGETLLIWGDVVHVPGLQFRRPEVGMVFDADAALAQQTRRDAFAAAARSRELVGGMHLPFPPLGHVAVGGDAFRWVPVLWNPTLASLNAAS
jgi:glyoxylase-like metal-dependent hydrolase (beta-lactamase superfamily II)